MISLDLICGREHVFEAWFRNGIVFNAQQAAGDIACPVCGSSDIFKAPSGSRHDRACLSEAGEEQLAHDLIQALERLCRSIKPEDDEDETDETREAKAESRAIRRDFSASGSGRLRDDGIEVIQIPWLRRRHNS